MKNVFKSNIVGGVILSLFAVVYLIIKMGFKEEVLLGLVKNFPMIFCIYYIISLSFFIPSYIINNKLIKEENVYKSVFYLSFLISSLIVYFDSQSLLKSITIYISIMLSNLITIIYYNYLKNERF